MNLLQKCLFKMKGTTTASKVESQMLLPNENQLKWGGFWPGRTQNITTVEIIICTVSLILIFVTILVPETLYIIQHFDNLLEVSQAISEMLSLVLSYIKMLLVLLYRSRLHGLIRDMKLMWNTYKVEYNTPEWLAVVDYTEKQSKYLTLGYVWTYAGLGMNFVLNPVFFVAATLYFRNITITPGLLPTPVKLGYPFDISNSWFNFCAAHAGADLGVFVSIFFMSSYDAFNLAMINYAATFFRLVNIKLDNLHKLYDNREDMQQNIMKDLSEIVKDHTKAIEFVERLEEVSHLFMIIQYLSSTFLLCMVGFHLTIYLENMYEFTHILTYCLCLNMQLYTFSWFGSKLIEESANVANSAYGCQWYDKPLKFQKSMVLIMGRSQRPVGISAAKFYLISLESFSKVLSASLSYFTLLQTVYND